ncbi:MAG: YfhO family protein [Candidatus Schekmanbacteria bacterium]|nr:YfhO family protein [Candidatus Schekmanbacteria bacterium]
MENNNLNKTNIYYKNSFIKVILFIIIIFAISPIFKDFSNISTKEDYLICFSYEYYSIKSILEFHEFPLWSPYFNGGYPIFAHPEASAANPWLFLFLCFDEVKGIKISIILSALIGAFGMFYLTKSVLKFNNASAFFSSLLFTLSGFNITILTEYWSQTIYFYYFLPLILATFIKSKEDKKFLIITSLLTLPILVCGALSFVILCLFLFLFSVFDAFSKSDSKVQFKLTLLKNLLIVLTLTSAIGMFKILPMVQLLARNIRAIDNYSMLDKFCIDFKILFDQLINPLNILPAYPSIYFGYIPILFCLLSLVFYTKQLWRIFFVLFIFIILTLGSKSPINILKLLWHLPFYHSILDIKEYSYPVISFLISLLSGKFLQITDDKKRLKVLKAVVISAALLSVGELLFIYQSSFTDIFNAKKPEVTSNKLFYQVRVIPQNNYNMRAFLQYKNLFNNVGTLNWESDIPLPINAEPKFMQDSGNNFNLIPNPRYKGEAYFLNPENKAAITKITSNLITVKINANSPDKLIINQNAFPGWRCSSGEIKPYNNLLSVDISKEGSHEVIFKFMPRSFYLGLLISAISFVISMLYLFWFSRV